MNTSNLIEQLATITDPRQAWKVEQFRNIPFIEWIKTLKLAPARELII